MTQWREQRGMDSYRPRQISQSDCEISSCGKILFTGNMKDGHYKTRFEKEANGSRKWPKFVESELIVLSCR